MSTQRHCIAVVENDRYVLDALDRLLTLVGFNVAPFLSAEAYLESAAAIEASCALIDIQLDGMSGLNLASSIVASGAAQPFILMTASDDPEIHRRARTSGCCAFLAKPFSGTQLETAIRKALALRT
jgi:FixJ family two-component response regulator